LPVPNPPTKFVVATFTPILGGTVKHKVLLNLGRLDEMEHNPSFQRPGLRLLEIIKS